MNSRLQHNRFNVVLNVEILRYSCYGAVDRQFDVRFFGFLVLFFVVSWLKLQLVAGRVRVRVSRTKKKPSSGSSVISMSKRSQTGNLSVQMFQ